MKKDLCKCPFHEEQDLSVERSENGGYYVKCNICMAWGSVENNEERAKKAWNWFFG